MKTANETVERDWRVAPSRSREWVSSWCGSRSETQHGFIAKHARVGNEDSLAEYFIQVDFPTAHTHPTATSGVHPVLEPHPFAGCISSQCERQDSIFFQHTTPQHVTRTPYPRPFSFGIRSFFRQCRPSPVRSGHYIITASLARDERAESGGMRPRRLDHGCTPSSILNGLRGIFPGCMAPVRYHVFPLAIPFCVSQRFSKTRKAQRRHISRCM